MIFQLQDNLHIYLILTNLEAIFSLNSFRNYDNSGYIIIDNFYLIKKNLRRYLN